MLICALVILQYDILYIEMDKKIFFKDLFESIPDYRKIVLLICIFQIDKDFLRETGFSERDISRSNLEFKSILMEQHEENLAYIKTKEGSVV